MKVAEMLKLLADDGWQLKRVKGSHRQFFRPTKPGKVTVAGKGERHDQTQDRSQHLAASWAQLNRPAGERPGEEAAA